MQIPTGAAERRLARVFASGLPLLLPALAFLVIVFLAPVVQLLSLSVVTPAGQVTMAPYGRLWSTPVYLQVLLNTLTISLATTLVCVVGGYPVAVLLSSAAPRARNALVLCVLLPFWTSFLVRTFAWMVLLGRNGAVNKLLAALGITDVPLSLMYNLAGVLVGMVHALMPMAILTMTSVMLNIDDNLARAASTLGARGGQTFWRVYFPLSLPGVTAGALLVFISALGFFITPALLGGVRQTMIAQVIIQHVQELLNWSFAGAISMLVLLSVLLLFYVFERTVGLTAMSGATAPDAAGPGRAGRLAGRIGARVLGVLGAACDRASAVFDRCLGARVDRRPVRWSHGVLWGVGLAVIGFLAVPTLFIVPVSFTTEAYIDWPPRGFSLKWYAAYLSSSQWVGATVRSFGVAVATGCVALALGIPAAFAFARRRVPGRTAVLAFILSPLVIPRIVFAVGIFYLYARLGLVGSSFGLVLGHTALALPYVVITVLAVLKTYDERLDQAAWTLGASRLRAFYHVTLPLIRTAIISAFLFAFITSFDELTIALFVTAGLANTLPKQMWDDALHKLSPTVAAVSTILLLAISALLLLSEWVRLRAARR
jgi:putative spermidine/putrescine transport system permease protein